MSTTIEQDPPTGTPGASTGDRTGDGAGVGGVGSGHPVVGFVTRLGTVLDTVGQVPVWSMTATEQRSVLIDLARAQARLEALRLRVLAHADASDIAAESAATSTAAWVAHHTGQTRTGPGGAHADLTLATALDGDQAATGHALAAGHLNPAQARVIVAALTTLTTLPGTVSATERARAEAHLIDLATHHDAHQLRVLARHLAEVIDPDAAETAEGHRLAAEEAAATRATYLHLHDNGDGTHTGRFKIPTLHATMLTRMLHTLTTPTHTPTPSTGGSLGCTGSRRVSRPETQGHAFTTLLERFPTDRLPTTGGISATVVVLLGYDQLLTGLGTAHLDTGQPLSAAQARRLACQAGIIPAVYTRTLGGPSVVLDLGRKTRLFTEPQRIALAIRDGGCTATGCDRPPGWCHAHHHTPWSQHGPTNFTNGRLLCAYHHHRAHDTTYTTTEHPDGTITFHHRT